LLPRLANRGQRHGGRGREFDVVVSDDGNLLKDPDFLPG
jgi:hypothetical protein